MVLHEAIRLAALAGDRETAVTAHREPGSVEVQAGRRQAAEAWLARAEALADTDAQLAPILGLRGMNASDVAEYPAAFALGRSLELVQEQRWIAFLPWPRPGCWPAASTTPPWPASSTAVRAKRPG